MFVFLCILVKFPLRDFGVSYWGIDWMWKREKIEQVNVEYMKGLKQESVGDEERERPRTGRGRQDKPLGTGI